MVNRFTQKAQQCLLNAKRSAEKMGHTYIGSEHLLLGILITDCVGRKILEEKKLDYAEVQKKLIEISGSGSFSSLSCDELTPKCKKIIECTSALARKFQSKFIGTEHFLYAICEENESVGARILSSFGINIQALKNEIVSFLDSASTVRKDKNEVAGAPNLSLYGRNLNELALQGKCDPLLCRDKALDRVIQILSRRTKNNPCLIGEPGVGKTAIVEGLAQKIVNKEVPESLLNKIIVSLDLSSMIAGAKYRGEFEERMRLVLNELRGNDNLILFIDELHSLIGAGAAEGAVDASNIIKPALARGEIHVIGATTIDEYRKHIEKDSALERQFQPILIEEPNIDEALKIIDGLCPRYESHHGVKISNDARENAVTMSVRYIHDRFLPDKAIDLIDEACSLVKMRKYNKSSALKVLETKLNELISKKEQAILDENFSLASNIRDEEIICKINYNKEKAKWDKSLSSTMPIVTKEDIASVVTSWTSIPVSTICKDEEAQLKKLETLLKDRIIGQDKAIKSVSDSIKRGRLGLKNPHRPIGSFLFLGPTGVGKTELAKAISEIVFGSLDSIIRIDMSEYMEKHSVSKLIGSPPGYIGYEEGGQLTEAVRRKPFSVVLFDELEKAHSDVYNILLQILEDGILKDSQGRQIDFKNTILIMTSNIGAKSITEPKLLGFSSDSFNDYEHMKAQINDALKTEFHPEFLNRLDEIIIFNKLSSEDIKKIAGIMLDDVKKLCMGIDIEVDFDDSIVSYLSDMGYDKLYGARPLRRLITSYIENGISEEILEGRIKNGDKIRVSSSENKLCFSKL